ncbi:hypothetical protein Scep_009433 [Stephania cephalantha]|uniref:Glutamyl-tRNA(Gln) amidotransferase subunit C, chloroplastic/mitochondrial n=1 Tax=Stephania cephalantha TaxID=152367 RepID=A0AAP0JT98_9MAGN
MAVANAALAMVGGIGVTMLQRQRNQLYSFMAKNPLGHALVRPRRDFSARSSSSLLPPDVPRLAETARIALTPDEVEEFAPKIGQIIDWFGQLQAIDLQNVDPALRADAESNNLREDFPETFDNREALLAAVPTYEKPYIKVPKVLNKD